MRRLAGNSIPLTCQTGQRSIRRQARDSRRPVRPTTKPSTAAPCPAFGANPFHAASAGALPSAALLMIRAPLNPSIAYDWSKPPSSYHGSAAVSTSNCKFARGAAFEPKASLSRFSPTGGCTTSTSSRLLCSFPLAGHQAENTAEESRSLHTHHAHLHDLTSRSRESAEIPRPPADSPPAPPTPSRVCTETAARAPARSAPDQ